MMMRERLSSEEERLLARSWRRQAAVERLVRANLALVISIAQQYRGAPLEELIAEGNVGLVRAAQKYDGRPGIRFASYATWWIRAAVQFHVMKSSRIVHAFTTNAGRLLFWNYVKTASHLEMCGQEVTVAAIARRLGVDEREVRELAPLFAGRDVSLDAPVRGLRAPGGDSRGRFVDLVVDPAASPEEQLAELEESAAFRQWLNVALKRLPPREREVIEGRFFAAPRLTLADLGRRWGLSRERARQLEAKALARLRRAAP